MIAFEDICVGHDKELFRVDKMQLETGTVYALVGSNGSGKSTFFKSLLGQIPFLSGKVLLNNEELIFKNPVERSKLLAFVESSFSGVEFLTVEDLILLGRTPYIGSIGRYSERDYAVLEETIQLFDLEAFRKLATDKLSDGERQIVAIARAIAQESQVILLDEPTAFLDYGNKKRILDLLISIAGEKNKTIILSTHDIDLSLEAKDSQILVIDKQKRKLVLEEGNISKNKILESGFGITSESLDK
jgi:iron complex transport system ATP-binding protein